MENIVERLRSVGHDYDFHENALIHVAANEIESLRAQLAEVTRERDAAKAQQAKTFLELSHTVNSCEQQLLATQANAARLVAQAEWVLEIHSDPTLCHEAVSMEWLNDLEAALSTPINLDALHEDRAEFIDDVAKRLLTEVCFKMGSGSPYRKMLHDYINTLREQAAAHRAKKEGK